jgi:hypothetical protein
VSGSRLALCPGSHHTPVTTNVGFLDRVLTRSPFIMSDASTAEVSRIHVHGTLVRPVPLYAVASNVSANPAAKFLLIHRSRATIRGVSTYIEKSI